MIAAATKQGPITAAELDAVADAVRAGLSLRSAAALHGAGVGTLAMWVRAADAGLAPFSAWLIELCAWSARNRLEVLQRLAELGKVDARAWRDWQRQQGAPSELERELDLIRRLPAAGLEPRQLLAARGAESFERKTDLTRGRSEGDDLAGDIEIGTYRDFIGEDLT